MIKVAIIGGGINSAVGKLHLSALRLSNNYQIVAASFSRNEVINYETSNNERINPSKIYSNYIEMIDDNIELLDAVIVLTPTDQHMEQVIYILKKGINVICEKSLAASVAEIFNIQNALVESKAKLFVIYNYIGYPMIKEIRSIISKGKVGQIFSIHVEMPQEGFVKTTNGVLRNPQSWRLKDNELIPTLSLDLGVHLHILIKYLTELEPLRVAAISRSRGLFNKVATEINALIEYTEDVVCNMWYSKTALGHRNGMKIRIYGSKGSIFWEQINPELVIFNDVDGTNFKLDRNSPNIEVANSEFYNVFKAGHPTGFLEGLTNYYNDIFENLTGKSAWKTYGIEESLEGLKLFEAINKSSNSREWVKI